MRRRIMSSADMTQGVIWRQMLLFFLPIMLGTFFQQLYNTVDAMVVGRFVGKEALAAVGGSASTLINLLVGFFVGLSSGATVIISQYYGAHDDQKMSRSVHTAIALSLVGGVIMMVLGIVFARPMLIMLNTPPETLEDSVTYMTIYFVGIIPALIYNVGTGILRAVGDSKRPLLFLIVCCALNIVLDLLFVVGFGMAVAGAAIATILSMFISALLVLWSLTHAQQGYRLFLKKIRLDWALLRQVLAIGMPAGFQSVLYSLSNMLIQSNINGFGTDAAAAWATYGKIDGIYWMILSALGIAATTFVGQNFGAGQIHRVHRSVRAAMVMSLIFAGVMSLTVHFGGRAFYAMFTTDEAVIQTGLKMMACITPFYCTYVAIEILSGAMRGVGESFGPMLLTCMGICALRVGWLLAAVPLNPCVEMVAFSYPITWVITSALFILYYLRGNWLKKRLPASTLPS